jgi:putative transposase
MLNEVYKVYKNNPPHLFKPKSKYMVTGSTYLKERHLTAPDSKKQLLLSILKGCQRYNWKLEDWVVLDNHYHLMLESPEEADFLPKLINEVHKFTAIWLRKNNLVDVPKKIFHNYWDSCVTFESSYFARLNYIYFNPVKHGYVTHPKDYCFGSYFYRYPGFSQELKSLERKYPFERVNVRDDF